MKAKTLNELISKIDELNQIHLSLRGILQYVNSTKNGKNKILWTSRIPSTNFKIEYTFENNLSDKSRDELNLLSDYLNQNFIVRLHSLLEYENIIGKKIKIDKDIEGHEMLEFIHFLRNEFAQNTGRFNPSDSESKKLRERLFTTFCIDPSESLPHQFPLDKNRVLKPIVEGTKKYVTSFFENKQKIKGL